MKMLMMSRPGARWTVKVCLLTIACGLGMHARAATIAVTYNFAGVPTGPPVQSGTTLTLDGRATGSVLSGNPSLNALWNPVTYNDHSVIDLTTGLLNGTFNMQFADGGTLSGNLFEDLSRTNAGVGPFTQTFTFNGGTREFAGATGSFSGTAVGTASGFTSSGSGTLNTPGVPEPASAALFLGGLAVIFVGLRRSKVKNSSVQTQDESAAAVST